VVRTIVLSSYLLMAACVACIMPAMAEEASDACSHFTWNVAHELAAMKQTATPITAASKPGTQVPQIQVGKLYELKLAPQNAITYSMQPAKPTLNDSTQGGLVRFRVAKAGLYRISITSGHWIDVVDGDQLVKSKDFQGSHGCARPHKIVEFELPANRDLMLQFSGATDATVAVAITAAAGPAPH
jgi:hypothetical protein